MKKIIIIVVALLILLGGGFFGYKTLFASKEKDDKKEASVDFEKAIEQQIAMETITTNLNKENHFIVTSFTIQADSEKSKKEFESRLVEMKSLSIQTFNNLAKSDIIAENGSKKVIDSLLDVYNQHLTNGSITNIYLTEFKVQ